MLYGQRPEQDELWYLAPYEFVTYWEPNLVKYPISVKAVDNDKYHATLTAKGKAKLAGGEWREAGEDLVPGEDYAVKDGMPGVWCRIQTRRQPRAFDTHGFSAVGATQRHQHLQAHQFHGTVEGRANARR